MPCSLALWAWGAGAKVGGRDALEEALGPGQVRARQRLVEGSLVAEGPGPLSLHPSLLPISRSC